MHWVPFWAVFNEAMIRDFQEDFWNVGRILEIISYIANCVKNTNANTTISRGYELLPGQIYREADDKQFYSLAHGSAMGMAPNRYGVATMCASK
jgi:hypothetical protein